MQSIAVITDSAKKSGRKSTVGSTIEANLLAVFADEVTIARYNIDELTAGSTIDEDLVMVMAGSRVVKIRKYVTRQDNIIVAKRTFARSGLYPLFSIPEGTDVLVVNDNIETVLESISSLYHIGIKHVNLIPFEAGKDYRHIHYAVTPSELELVPSYIENVYDVGGRVVDIPTLLLVSSRLHLSNKKTQQNIYSYYQDIWSPNEGIIENYNELLSRTEELDLVLSLSHDGIVLTDEQGIVLISNKRFTDLFELRGKPEGRFLHDLLPDMGLEACYGSNFQDDLLKVKKKVINLEVNRVRHFKGEQRLYFSFQEVTHIKKLEQNMTRKLREKGQTARYTFEDIFCSTKDMQVIVNKAKKIAKTDLTVLITGESGTGKEILAQAIHNASSRQGQPFIAVNSAAIPDSLIESELFGYASGSFTGALREGRKGLFEQANNGTVFLDEIGDMPSYLQSKLLRVLQERQIMPIGSDRTIDIDIRVIAATHKSPIEMIQQGNFRKDLFYRLNVFPLELPALKNRREDILLLLKEFTRDRYSFSAECSNLLLSYAWPGNIRELHNVAQYISTIEEGDTVGTESLPLYLVKPHREPDSGQKEQVYSDLQLLISHKSDPELAGTVLEGIRLLNSIGKTAGRKHLLEHLELSSKSMKEGKLRSILTVLSNADLIHAQRGRSGCRITEKGKLYLDLHQNTGS